MSTIKMDHNTERQRTHLQRRKISAAIKVSRVMNNNLLLLLLLNCSHLVLNLEVGTRASLQRQRRSH
jgi:hypothetical protein